MLDFLQQVMCSTNQWDTPQYYFSWLPEDAQKALGEPDSSSGTLLPESPEKASTARFVASQKGGSFPDGRWSPVLIAGKGIPEQLALSEQDLEELADIYRINICNLKAVLAVESAGSGFLLSEPAPSRPKILFEAHWFYKLTPQPVSKVRPDLSTPRWNKSLYKGGSAEYSRLEDAVSFDYHNALKSASWGLGQVMGFNFELAGCDRVEQFVVEAFEGEKQQFKHMLNFIENTDLMGHLRNNRWAAFAKGYNGSGYKANKYDRRLAAAAKRCK